MPRRRAGEEAWQPSEGDLEVCTCGHEHWLHFLGGGYCEEVVEAIRETRSGRKRCACMSFEVAP